MLHLPVPLFTTKAVEPGETGISQVISSRKGQKKDAQVQWTHALTALAFEVTGKLGEVVCDPSPWEADTDGSLSLRPT